MKFVYRNVYLLMGYNKLECGGFHKSRAVATKNRGVPSEHTMHIGVLQMCRDAHTNVHVCFYPRPAIRRFLDHSTAQFGARHV